MHTYAYGKALLILTKDGERPWPNHHVYFQSMNMVGDGDLGATYDSVIELFSCAVIIGWFNHQIRNMKDGETWRIYLTFEAQGYKDYFGEYDEDLLINKWKVLRKQKPKEYYQCK